MYAAIVLPQCLHVGSLASVWGGKKYHLIFLSVWLTSCFQSLAFSIRQPRETLTLHSFVRSEKYFVYFSEITSNTRQKASLLNISSMINLPSKGSIW